MLFLQRGIYIKQPTIILVKITKRKIGEKKWRRKCKLTNLKVQVYVCVWQFSARSTSHSLHEGNHFSPLWDIINPTPLHSLSPRDGPFHEMDCGLQVFRPLHQSFMNKCYGKFLPYYHSGIEKVINVHVLKYHTFGLSKGSWMWRKREEIKSGELCKHFFHTNFSSIHPHPNDP